MVTDVHPETNVELLQRKKVFCYDYLDSFTRFDQPELPLRETAFVNKLGGVKCSQADYSHAQHVLEKFYIQSLKEYMVSIC